MATLSYTIKVAVPVIAILLAAPAYGQDLEAWRHKLIESRERLPAFKCVADEEFHVRQESSALQDPGVMELSWGDRNAHRQTLLAYSGGKVSVSCEKRSGRDVPDVEQDFRYLINGDKAYSAVGHGYQGTIDSPEEFKVFWMPDALMGYFMRDGRPWDVVVPSDATLNASQEVQTVRWGYGSGEMRLDCDPSTGVVRSWALERGGNLVVRGSLGASRQVQGAELPSDALTVWYDKGQEVKRLTTALQYEGTPQSNDFVMHWGKKGLVRDNITHKIYRIVDGKLVLDPVFTEALNQKYGLASPLFIFGFAGLCVVGSAITLKRRSKKRTGL